ncbi:MAG: SagB/ThcOx family dehydrogenase [Candidatus Cloacimonetes bacterium]|nr:SagB/ThcOx family dehydrogenase [Candidatus Cloacimonadota bacterium]
MTISCAERTDTKSISSGEIINLPEPALDSDHSIEQALQNRRSVRRYSDNPVDLQAVSQILWSAQGITHEDRGYKTAPSAGATFPLEIYAAVGNVEGLSAGLYHYVPDNHHLVKIHNQDLRAELSSAALRQTSIRDGAFVVIIAAIFERTTGRYGERGIKYVHMEVGHVGQNIHLQAESLGLGTVVIGAFNDEEMKRVLDLPPDQIPLYLMPLGHK